MSGLSETTKVTAATGRRSAALAGLARARINEDPEDAAKLALKAVEAGRAENDQHAVAIGMLLISLACHAAGHDPEQVLRPVLYAINEFVALGDQRHLAEARLLHATLLFGQFAYDEAEFEARSARALAVACADRHLVAMCDVRLASVLAESQGPDPAAYRQAFLAAVKTFVEFGDRENAARALFNLGTISVLDDPRLAVTSSGQALSLVDDTSIYAAGLHLVRAEAAIRLGWTSVADSELADYESVARQHPVDGNDELAYLMTLAMQHRALGRLAEAETEIRKALAISRETNNSFYLVTVSETLAEILELQGDLVGALAAAREHHTEYQRLQLDQTRRRRAMFDLSGRLETERQKAEHAHAEQRSLKQSVEAATAGLVRAEQQLELERSRRALVELRASRDPAIEPRTGLPSLAAIAGGVTKLLDQLQRVAVVIISVDDDRVVAPLPNDRQRLMQEISARAHAFLKRIDGAFAGSLGSEDIVGVIPVADGASVEAVLESFHRQLIRPVDLIDRVVAVAVQFGVAVAPEHGIRANGLLSRARLSAQAARQARPFGPDIAVFEQSVEERQQLRMFVHEQLGRAVDAGHIEIAFQPKIAAASGVVVGAEALVRWTDPIRGPISPALFIPFAEETGHIVELGGHVLTRACCEAAAWPIINGHQPKVSVNVSAAQFAGGALLAQVDAALLVSGLKPQQLSLELTESALARTTDVVPVLADLRARGIAIEIDDFGTGYSSFGYLTRFPVDCVKIDKSFVDRVANSADDAAITQAIITMAHSLRLSVVAEGVETWAQATVLREQGCDSFQGWYFAKSMSSAEFVAWLGMQTVSLSRS